RYQQTLANEVLRAGVYQSEQQRRDRLPTWLIHYNYHRPHSAAGNQPPASRLKTGVTNVMPGYN
ncbi:MAG: integrase core domain-containing protein, partial [Acidimicrobiales bacterium]